MKNHKVICVGLHKTGTTSLEVALKSVHYRVAGHFGIDNAGIYRDALPMAANILKEYDAAQDDPWYMLYRELDHEFPNSKFILTTRNSQKWIKSCVEHFGGQQNEVRKWFYGSGKDDPCGNESHWITAKDKHEAEVRDYFKNRGDDFLEMDITRGDNWAVLGPFLKINKHGEFPHVNTRINRFHHDLWLRYDQSTIASEKLFLRCCLKIVRSIDNAIKK